MGNGGMGERGGRVQTPRHSTLLCKATALKTAGLVTALGVQWQEVGGNPTCPQHFTTGHPIPSDPDPELLPTYSAVLSPTHSSDC